jgi:membrane protein implicated in regulation of membrane protease activity
MGIRIPNLALLVLSLGVGALAVYLENVAVAAICFSIAVFYAALILWQWRRRKKKQRTAGDRDPISRE